MHIYMLSLFPKMFEGPFNESIVKRAVDRGLVQIDIYNIRDYAQDKHKVVDDYPYGGGAGMVMKPEPLFDAVEAVKKNIASQVHKEGSLSGGEAQDSTSVILLTPQGRLFQQKMAGELAQKPNLILVCGHYEGVDERVREHLVTDEISIGDYVLTGGELAAMVVVDAVVRLLPGALGSSASAEDGSHVMGLLQYPQYTRPPSFRGWEVPATLLSGNHDAIARWRRKQSILRTLKRRPDLLMQAPLTDEERQFVEEEKGAV